MTPLYENPHNHNQHNHIINMPMQMLFTAINRPDKLCPLSSMRHGINNSTFAYIQSLHIDCNDD